MQLRVSIRALGTSVAASVAILVAASLLPISSAVAESRSVRFEQISRQQGLSQSFVYTIVQDNDGYLWFGTQEGLNRFDGFEFKVFAHDPDDPGSISDESIRTMIRDQSGTLWIGTDAGGLSRYESNEERFINFTHDPSDPSSIADNRVRVVYEDRSRELWIGTDGSGLDHFDRESQNFMHFPHDPSNARSLSGSHVWDILEDADGALWVATDAGLNKFDRQRGTFAHFRHDPGDPTSISDDSLRALFEDSDGNLWIGTENGGLNLLNRATGSFERFMHDADDPSSISANRINTIYEDNSGVLWIGTVEGLNAWNPNTRNFDRYRKDPGDRYSLSHDNVLSIFQDRGGVLWVGTYDGLSKWPLSTRAMLHFRNDADDPRSLTENTVTSFAENPDGDIWVGTFGGGLNLLDGDTGRFQQIRHSPDDEASLSSDRVMALLVDSEGVLWAGTRAAGLNRYDAPSNSFTRFQHDPGDPSSISANGVTYILEDRKKGLWIATFGGGLNYFDRDTGQFRHFRSDPDDPLSLSNDRVLVLFEDSAGSIWVGTYGGGLNLVEPVSGTFTRYRGEPDRPDGLSGDEIYMIQEGANGDLWIGVKGAGLNRWRRNDREAGKATFQRFGELEGLPSSTIYSGAWDSEGDLWLSTARGLSRLDVETLQFRNYDNSHGLQGEEFNLSAGFGASNGQLFFGGLNGFNVFQPELMNGNRQPPQVAITAFTSLNEPVDLSESRRSGEAVALKHDQYVLGFEFTALDFAAPEKSRYLYQLEGLDEDWVDAGSNRQVTYSNLPAGEYRFRVKATNNDGVWSTQDAVLAFQVLPAPWRTWWAYLAYFVMLAAIAVFAFRAYDKRTRLAARLQHAKEISLVQARLKEAQRIASIGNWELDVTSNDLWWSDEIYRLFQLDPDGFGANYESFLERVHPGDRRAVDDAVQRALSGHEPYSIDHRIIREDGTERVVHETAEVHLNEEGKPVRMAGTVHDITERKKAEDEFRRRADFQAMLAGLSSDLIRAQPDDIDKQLGNCFETIGSRYDLDVVSVWWLDKDTQMMRSIHRWVRDDDRVRQFQLGQAEIPWIAAQLLAGELVVCDDVEDLPEEAATDRIVLNKRKTKSFLIVPLLVNDNLAGSCVFSTVRAKRGWPDETVAELKLISENLAGAIARATAVTRIRELKDQLQQENLYLRDEIRLAHGFTEIIGEDPELRKCLQQVEKVAPTDTTVLILGETGTGKELFARAVHKLSDRREGPMVSVNCPALPSNLIESELFGHEKGAFTGAQSQRRGRFELADGGTLFLDEIGELPLDLQSKLLRVLQTGEFERLGGTKTLKANVRLIAATNRNLVSAIERGEFRADLFYRISSFPIRLPALRDRNGDIALLAEHFVHKHAGRIGKNIDAISAKMVRELATYSWPGNVRELESIIERSLISAEDNTVLELPGPLKLIATMKQSKVDLAIDDGADLFEVERAYIVNVLEQTDWKISGAGGAASVLGIPSSTLRSKMKRLGITRQSH